MEIERDGTENEPAMDNLQWTTCSGQGDVLSGDVLSEGIFPGNVFSGGIRSSRWPKCARNDSPQKPGLPSEKLDFQVSRGSTQKMRISRLDFYARIMHNTGAKG